MFDFEMRYSVSLKIRQSEKHAVAQSVGKSSKQPLGKSASQLLILFLGRLLPHQLTRGCGWSGMGWPGWAAGSPAVPTPDWLPGWLAGCQYTVWCASSNSTRLGATHPLLEPFLPAISVDAANLNLTLQLNCDKDDKLVQICPLGVSWQSWQWGCGGGGGNWGGASCRGGGGETRPRPRIPSWLPFTWVTYERCQTPPMSGQG